MGKISLGDKLKYIFSPEKGKAIGDYIYNNIIKPTAKNAIYNAGVTAWGMVCGKDPNTIPLNTNGPTPYSKIGQISSISKPAELSYLPKPQTNPTKTAWDHRDITWIEFETPYEANKIVELMYSNIERNRWCSVLKVYEALGWAKYVDVTDQDYGWSNTQGIGVYTRNGKSYITAPLAKPINS